MKSSIEKKILSGMIIMMLSLAVAMGQVLPGSVQVGVEGGPSASTNTFDGNFDYVFNNCSGLAVLYHIKDLFVVKSGLDFERKGYVGDLEYFHPNNLPGYTSGNDLERLDYLDIPVMVRATYTNKIYIFGEAGAYIGYLLKANSSGSILTWTGENQNFNVNSTSNYNRFDAGACLGAGIGLSFTSRWVVELEGRLNVGLTEIVPENGGKTPSNLSENMVLGIRYVLIE